MVTRRDLENLDKMQEAQKLRKQGYSPEMALRLAGVNWVPGVGYINRNFTNEEAKAIFAKDDFAWEIAKKEVARERRAWKLRRVAKFIQFVIAIVLAIAVARVWGLF